MESVGFKEWALVCEALGRGEQTIILRKGGIAEGREGFSFKHREFFLFPTFFHEQLERVRGGPGQLPQQRDGEVEIRFFAKVELAAIVTSWETAAALERFHVLQREVVRDRFEYDEAPGVHAAFVRVYQLSAAWTFPSAREYGGCRSWVQLPHVPPGITFDPVLRDPEHAARLEDFRVTVGQRESAAA